MVMMVILVAQSDSGGPPTIEYAGRSLDDSQLLFDIRNSSAAAWSFYGAAPDAPAYEFQMPSGRRVQAIADTASTIRRHARYPVPAHGKVRFALPLPPGDTSSINVKVRLFPESHPVMRNRIEYYSNRLRLLLGEKARSSAMLQESGTISFWQQ
jgi:hypothetical protein